MMKAFNDVIYEWLNGVWPEPMVWILREQNVIPPIPQNATKYGFFSVIAKVRKGIDGSISKYNADDDKFDVLAFSFREATVSLEVLSNDQSAQDVIDRAIVSLVLPTVVENMTANNVGIIDYSEVRNLSYLESGFMKKRFQVDVRFNIIDTVSEQIDRIVEAPVDGDITR